VLVIPPPLCIHHGDDDYDHESSTVNKNPPPGLDQLWHGVADYGVLSTFSSVVCRVRVLGTSGVGSGGLASSVSAGMNGMVGKNGNGRAAEASAYPLVEATVEFLKEFVVDDDRSKEKGNANANINGKIASGSASGSRSSSTSRTSSSRGGKGKERERERGDSIHDASGGRGKTTMGGQSHFGRRMYTMR
jgi:hypothetical protein